MTFSPLPRTRRRLAALGVLTAMVAGVTGLSTGAAYAEPPSSCNLNLEHEWYEVSSAAVDPVLTHWKGITIAPGTTGSIETTLTEVEAVSTTFNTSTEISAEAKVFLAKVAVKVGFSVQTGKSTTSTWSQKVTLNFNRPGDYAVFKGTHRVRGSADVFVCLPSGDPWNPGPGFWAYAFGSHPAYTTFDAEVEGTVSCDTPVTPGTVQELARNKLICR